MTERRRRRPPPASQGSAAVLLARDDDVERALGRAIALGLPVVTVGAAIAVGVVANLGSALLVIASGALLGAIGLFWVSVRTLSGEAPLARGSEEPARSGIPALDELAERKRRVLRALKDLESEHALGKIDDADYEAFVASYRDEAKAVIRQMDELMAPLRDQAEKLASEYLKQRGVSAAQSGDTSATSGRGQATRLDCSACGASNEGDALFCKHCGASLPRQSRA